MHARSITAAVRIRAGGVLVDSRLGVLTGLPTYGYGILRSSAVGAIVLARILPLVGDGCHDFVRTVGRKIQQCVDFGLIDGPIPLASEAAQHFIYLRVDGN